MLYLLFIALHTVAGLIAFAAGCLVLRRRSYFPTYMWSLVALVAFLAAVVALDWPELNAASRVLFSALTALGGYMLWRMMQARRLLLAEDGDSRLRFIDHVGFTLVALFIGFIAIAVIDLGAPGWVAPLVAVGSVAAGRAALKKLKIREASRTPRAPAVTPRV